MTIDATASTLSHLTSGTATLGGTLQMTTVGSPALGASFTPISVAASSLSGTFATFKYGTADYDTAYSSSVVTLIVGKPFVLTGKNVTAIEDTPVTSVPVTTWTDDDQTGSTYTVTINWGDTTQPNGTVSTTGTGGTVKGSHTWASAGTFTITTTVIDSTGTTRSVTSTATVHVAPLPTVTTVARSGVRQHSEVNLVVNGTGFTADSAVGFSNTGITIDSVTFVKSTQLKVAIDVAANAPLGAGNVTVTTDGGTGTCTNCRTVNAPPTVTGASPNLPRGVTTVETVTGTGFQTGLTVTTSIPGATVGAPQGITATSFTVSITVPAGDATGTH
jgi:large repetitive protein